MTQTNTPATLTSPATPGTAAAQVTIGQPILSKNAQKAEENRADFQSRGLFVINLLSSPGSGKTMLLQRTLAELSGRWRMGVIVGDLQTDNDARRLRASAGDAPIDQITTGTVCHLDAQMVARSVARLDLSEVRLLFIENVGNLVCPANYDLGENIRVTLLSVTEGEDKPLKYPVIFKRADVVLINKIDMAQAAGFDRQLALENLRRINPDARVLEVSARTGQGMDQWYELLESYVKRN